MGNTKSKNEDGYLVDNALHIAAKAGNLARVQDHVRNFDINAKGEDDGTALYWAAREGKTEVVKLLLSFNPDVNLPNKYGSSPLTVAASRGHNEIVQTLLKVHGININHTDKYGSSALMLAAGDGRTVMIEALLKVDGINVNHASNEGRTALIVAADRGRKEIVQDLLKVDGINVNHANNQGQSALTVAAAGGHTKIVHDLLKVDGINVNQADNDGSSPLTVAASRGNSEIVQALLKVDGIDINHADNNGETALWMASNKGHLEVVKAIVAAGADLSIASKNGRKPIDVARTVEMKEIFRNPASCMFCYAAGAGNLVEVQSLVGTINVNCLGTNGETATFKACAAGHADVVQFLTSHGADVNIANIQGIQPIDIAAKNVHIEVFHVLAAHGASLDKSLLIVASKTNLMAVVTLLNLGADASIKNSDGKTCLDQFSASDKLKILTMVELKLSLLEAHNYFLWFVIVQVADAIDADLYTKLLAKVAALVSTYPSLADAKDADGRAAVDVASKPMKAIIQSVLLWHGRYRITEPRPEHISATCFVFKAVDEHTIDMETSQPIRVALKLMRLKDQFQREILTRDKGFNQEHVMHILQTHPQIGSSTLYSWPNEVIDVEADATGQLTKTNAEKFFLLVMPLADRNLFVALKQERWAGKNMEEVRHVFVQLVHCVEHMHEKGVLHADLKTLNIVRTSGQWKLIDLDAACAIGKEPVGHKSSSAYVPPEAIYIDEKTDTACVRSVVAVTNGEATYELLTAHPSFDVWSLGCMLYQMCTTDVKPLFQGGQDDNVVGVRKGVDNLFALAEWSPELKADKLADVPDKFARNLLSQMLHKDPLQRPSLSRVLAHSFLSGKKVARLIGEKPKYDIFLSYRVASDAHHLEKLYNLLTAQGFKVYWDKLCLEPGVDWEQGFCEGLVSSRAFVPLLSRDAINHPDKAWQNFSKLMPESKCDNVFLEHRLAVELQGLGLIEKIFPVFIGNLDAATSEYSNYFSSGCHPSLSEVTVKSVEEKLRHHMESQALGTPIVPDRTVASVVGAITACQGAFIVGPVDATFEAAADSIVKMLTDVPLTQSPRGGTHVHQALKDTIDNKTLVARHSDLKKENCILRTALGSIRSGEFTSVEALAAHVEALLQG